MSSSVAFKPIDPKRDEFRRYLERAGVIEALTKVVIKVVKERPQNPLEYLRNNLGGWEADEYAYLQKELEEARCEIVRLRKIIESVNPDALLEEKPKLAGTTDIGAEEEFDSEPNTKEDAVIKELNELEIEENKET